MNGSSCGLVCDKRTAEMLADAVIRKFVTVLDGPPLAASMLPTVGMVKTAHKPEQSALDPIVIRIGYDGVFSAAPQHPDEVTTANDVAEAVYQIVIANSRVHVAEVSP